MLHPRENESIVSHTYTDFHHQAKRSSFMSADIKRCRYASFVCFGLQSLSFISSFIARYQFANSGDVLLTASPGVSIQGASRDIAIPGDVRFSRLSITCNIVNEN